MSILDDLVLRHITIEEVAHLTTFHLCRVMLALGDARVVHLPHTCFTALLLLLLAYLLVFISLHDIVFVFWSLILPRKPCAILRVFVSVWSIFEVKLQLPDRVILVELENFLYLLGYCLLFDHDGASS